MTLNTIMNSAVSGLSVAQTALRTTSANIANVNTPNYARKVVSQETVSLGGTPAGVAISDIRRVTDRFLSTELRASTAENGRLDVAAQFQDLVQSLFGNPEDNSSIAGQLDTALNGLSSLTVDPTSVAHRLAAIDDLNSLGDELARMASKLQDYRSEADKQVGEQVAVANDAIARIYDLNQQIVKAKITSGDSSGLEDLRASALADLSKVVGFTTYDMGNGTLAVSLPNGQPLVDSFQYRLDYAQSGAVTGETAFTPLTTTRIDSRTGQAVGAPAAIESGITSGAIRGLLDARDTDLPNLAEQVGQFAASLVDQINAIHNENTAVPAPSTLAGRNTGLLGTDAAGFTGSASFFVTDATNTVVANTTIDFSTAGLTDIDAIVTAINAGLGGAATATFANGALTLTATAPSGGVAIRQDSPPSQRGGAGFSQFFGMNDLMVSQVRPDAATGLAGTDLHGFATGVVSLEMRGPGGATQSFALDMTTLPGGDLDDVVTALNTGFAGVATFALDSSGSLTVTPSAANAGWKLAVTGDTTDRGGTGVSMSDLFGMGLANKTDRALGVAVRSDIAAAPAKLALGRLDAAATTGTALARGDARGAVALAGAAANQVSFDAAGGIGAQTSKLGDYAAQIVSRAANAAASAHTQADNRQAVQDELVKRLASVEGVNLDEELSNMITLQSAYNASARMISTVKDMFDTLLNL